jgi:CubicO group peptidase (beta-lactamase class C family)
MPDTLYQAASLSKFIAAIGTMRLVEDGTLTLDEDLNAKLTSWQVPSNEFDATHKVTLRGLLSMTGGIGVPGFLGYEVGAPLPTLKQVLDGAPPANSPPATVIAVPGSAYRYSGGGYEIAEALMQDVTGKSFPQLMQDLVFDPMNMTASSFEQPPNATLAPKAASGHFSDGRELSGHWHVFPEHAAAGLWSTPTDLAKLLVQLADVWQGLSSIFLRRQMLEEMLTPQNGGTYGLGAAVAGDGASLVLMKRGQNVVIRAI